ncbi:DNA glycosylase [Lasiodiplodia theobromae]|nr:DNA glycosylase [Lasiodiplodia theobromae]
MKRTGSDASESSSAFTGPSRRGSNESTGSRPGLRSFSRKQSSVSEAPKSSASPTSERGPVGHFVCVGIWKKPRNPQDDEVLMYDLQDLDDEKHSSPKAPQQDASMDDDPDIGKGERQEGLPPEDDRIVDIEVGVKPENHATEEDVPIAEPNDSRDKEHKSPLKNNNEAEQHDVITISSDKSSSEDDSSSEGEQFVRAVHKTPVVSIHRRDTQSSSNAPGRDIDRNRRGTSEEYPWISHERRDESVRSAKSNPRRSQIPQSELTGPDDVPQIDGVVVAKMQSAPPSPKLIRAHSEAGSRASSVDNEPKGFLRPDGSLSAQKRRTGLRSPHFVLTRVSQKSKRPPAGTISSLPFPSTEAPRFGLIQEELAHEPFQLLIAVMFLNKTKGSKAIPIFREFIARYPSPDELAHANLLDITSMLRPLGLQNSRAKMLINFAKCWLIDPPRFGRRYRCVNYPYKGAQKDIKPGEVLNDVDPRVAAYEVAHLPGCGPYALDSWRIFCRDALRGVALDWNGTGVGDEGFEPEWKRVKPGDKELKAFLKWMWLREGWAWDPKTGERALAKREEVKTAEKSWRWDQESGEDVWIEGGMDENEAGEIDAAPPHTLPARANEFRGSVESDDSTSADEADHLGDLSDDSQQDNGTCEEDNSSQLVAAQIAHEVDLSQNRPLTQVPATQPSPRSPFPTSIASVIGDDEAMEKATDSEAGDSSPYAPLTGVERMFTECEKEAEWYFTGEVSETPQPDSPTKRAEREAAKAIAVDKSSPSSPIEYRSDGDGGNEIDEMEGVEDGSARQASPEL